MLYPVHYEIADIIMRHFGCEVSMLEGWESQVGVHLAPPLDKSTQVVRIAVQQLENVGIVVIQSRLARVQDGQVCPSDDDMAGLLETSEVQRVSFISIDSEALRRSSQVPLESVNA